MSITVTKLEDEPWAKFINGTYEIGMMIAIAVSYTTNHHIGWAFLHGLASWFYLIYRALGYGA